MKNILFVNSASKTCGVYQYGLSAYQAISKTSGKFSFSYLECTDKEQLLTELKKQPFDAIIFNYYPAVLPFLDKTLLITLRNYTRICLVHDMDEQDFDSDENKGFDYFIFGDPTLQSSNPRVFKIGRIIPEYSNPFPYPEIPTVGSFGFSGRNKGYEQLILQVQKEFDQAIIRLNISFNEVVDPHGEDAKKYAEECKSLIMKKGIKLETTHHFFSKSDLLDFLAQNSINVFFYKDQVTKGIASAPDYALAVNRPIAISDCKMLRHLHHLKPSIVVDGSISSKSKLFFSNCKTRLDHLRGLDGILYTSLKKILSKFRHHEKIYQPILSKWTEKQFALDLEKILSKIEELEAQPKFNRILDDSARVQLESAIQKLFQLTPEMMARKIPRANVQQGFILDAVQRLGVRKQSILCVGSFEDTACEALIKLGYQIESIDPAINYDLNTFVQKIAGPRKFDLIFSTSVLEHVEDDELFLSQIVNLLSPGGIALLTCDYKEDYKTGDALFSGNYRFYTQCDFQTRFAGIFSTCKLLDAPSWNCPNPDFSLGGQVYTFATLAFQKTT